MERKKVIRGMKRALKKHGVRRAYLFGSFARGENNCSDIDVAISPPKNFSLLDMAGLLLELEGVAKKKVDLVSLRSMNPRIMLHIRKDLAAIL